MLQIDEVGLLVGQNFYSSPLYRVLVHEIKVNKNRKNQTNDRISRSIFLSNLNWC